MKKMYSKIVIICAGLFSFSSLMMGMNQENERMEEPTIEPLEISSPIATIPTPQKVEHLCCTDKSLFFAGSYSSKVLMYDLGTFKKINELNSCPMVSMCGTKDFLFTTDGWTINRWGLKNNFKCIGTKDDSFKIGSMCYGSDNNTLFSARYKSDWGWSIFKGNEKLFAAERDIDQICYKNGSLFSIAGLKSVHFWGQSVEETESKKICVWKTNVVDGEKPLLKELKGHKETISSICCGENHVFSGDFDNEIRVWDLKNLECIKILQGHNNSILSLYATEKYLVSADGGGTIRIWDLQNFTCVAVLKRKGNYEPIRALVFKNGLLFSGADDKTISVWNMDKIIKENKVKSDECVFCLEKMNDDSNLFTALPCNHIFHETCLRKWFEAQKDTCPLCREKICYVENKTKKFELRAKKK